MLLFENFIEPLFHGLIVGISLVVSIGPQNAFVIRHGLARRFLPFVIIACILSDTLLISIGVFGTAEIFQKNKIASLLTGAIGVLFLIFYSFLCFKNAFSSSTKEVDLESKVCSSRKAAFLQAIAFTLFNPAAIMETVVIIGGVSSQYSNHFETSFYFIGTVAASILWFISLGIFTKVLYPLFKIPLSWKMLDIFTGIIMLMIAVSLIDGLYEKFA
jgi:L-lysine exporter family protein LysE/ArgO